MLTFLIALAITPLECAAATWQQWAWFDYPSTTLCDAADPHHCFGNGDCVAGTCQCEIGWRGAYCSQLDLLPAKRAAHGLPLNSWMPTWGGSAAFDHDAGRWHFLTGAKLFNVSLTKPAYSEWDSGVHSPAPAPDTFWGRSPPYNASAASHGGDPFGGAYPWEFTTTIDPYDPSAHPDLYGRAYLVRMTSSGADPAGPYSMAAVEQRAFRADWKRRYGATATTDPLFLLTIGTVGEAGPYGMLIKYSASGSPLGPWDERVVYEFETNGHGASHNGSQWDCDVKDPSFVVHAGERESCTLDHSPAALFSRSHSHLLILCSSSAHPRVRVSLGAACLSVLRAR